MKLRTKLIISVLAGSLFVSVLAGIASFYYTRSALEKVISQEQLNLAKQTADKIDRLLFERYWDIQTIAGSSALRGFLENTVPFEQGKSRFDRLKETTGPWDTILLSDKDGNIVFSDDPSQTGKKINPDDYPSNFIGLKEALAGKTYYSDVVISKITDKPTIVFASPVRYSDDQSSEIIGAVIGQFDWTTIYHTLSELGTVHAHIYNSRGFLIGSNLEEQNNAILKDNMPANGIFQHASESNNMSMSMRSNEDSFDSLTSHFVFTGYKSYGGNHWMLILETPTSVAFAPARDGAYWQALIISAMSPLLFLIVIFIINRLLFKPLNVFTGTFKEIAAGNLDAKIDLEGQDEIGQLAKGFNDMITELRETRENIEKKVAQRTDDLEKINKFMVGREIKMIDLKKQIKDLTENQCSKE